MLQLQFNDYFKAIEPLKEVSINKLFARFIVEKHLTGKIYVDQIENPSTFYIVHPYGMSLLFGETENESFNIQFVNYMLNKSRDRQNYDWMQAWPDAWHLKLDQLLGNKLVLQTNNITDRTDVTEIHTRVNFRFNRDKYQTFRKNLPFSQKPVVRVDNKIFEAMHGRVVPKFFWENANHFLKDGVGFSLMVDGKPASTAYTAYVVDHEYELGIETVETCRGKGYAQYACAALIDYIIEKNFEPVWSCRLENTSSYMLAQKLGFEPILELPYYRLGL